jgi:hypothetical protein
MQIKPTEPCEDTKPPDEIGSLLSSWRRSLAARRASPATIATYTSAVEPILAEPDPRRSWRIRPVHANVIDLMGWLGASVERQRDERY